jgi:hypothetical protein
LLFYWGFERFNLFSGNLRIEADPFRRRFLRGFDRSLRFECWKRRAYDLAARPRATG